MSSISVFSSTLDSVIEQVDGAEASIRQFAKDAGFSDDDQYFIGLAAREILINAMKHGNQFDPAKKVDLRLAMNGKDLVIEVTDQGEGFRVEKVPDPHLPENRMRTSGRGITMTVAIMDEFTVDRNASGGTHVRMVKRLRSQ